MHLSIGTRLGPYEISGPLGAGGMGEVYRARDTKLGRSVAVKILPDAFALDPDRLARFEREAKVLASLNHPHITALHGMEDSEGRHFLVMELVEGETLAARLTKGPLPPAEVLRLGGQIADALDRAEPSSLEAQFNDMRDTWMESLSKWTKFVSEASRGETPDAEQLRGIGEEADHAPVVVHHGTAAIAAARGIHG